MSLCECGCGRTPAIADQTRPERGHVKGQPFRYVHGHNTRRPLAERFWEKVDKSGDCWIWTAALDRHGYGGFAMNKTTVRAHRVAYELTKGAIPEKYDLDHLCRNPACVNPAHLEAVTRQENILRGFRARRGEPIVQVDGIEYCTPLRVVSRG